MPSPIVAGIASAVRRMADGPQAGLPASQAKPPAGPAQPLSPEQVRNLFQEISTSRGIGLGLQILRMANPDLLVGRQGLRVFETMRHDDQVKAALSLKKYAVLSTGWDVVPPDGYDTDDQQIEIAEFVRHVFEHELEEDLGDYLWNVLCLHGDTVIHSPEGDAPIRDLVGRRPLVFSCVNGELTLARASKVVLSGQNTPCVKVAYRWGSGRGRNRRFKEASIICTDTHPFLLRDGSYRRAGRLRAGDRLMPFDTAQRMTGGYWSITPPCGDLVKRAAWVWEHLHGPVPIGHAVHHLDGDRAYDAPENLSVKPCGRHVADHTRERAARMTEEEKLAWTAPMRSAQREAMADAARHAAWRANLRAALSLPAVRSMRSEAQMLTWTDPGVAGRRVSGMRAAWTPERRAALAERNRSRMWTPEMLAKKSASQRYALAAKKLAGNHEVVSVEPWGLADVYDMQVPGAGNFAANYAFVHNSALDFGFSVSECVWKPITEGKWTGKIGLRKLSVRPPRSFTFKVDLHDNLAPDGIEQWGRGLPVDRFAIYSHLKEFGNWYGISDLRSAYRPWWFKDNAWKWWGIFLDRYSIPLAEGILDQTQGAVFSPTDVSALETLLKNIQSETAFIHPSDVHVQFPTVGTAQGSEIFEKAIEASNKGIARAILMPQLLGVAEQGRTGSYSQARKQFDVFILVVEKLQNDLADYVLGAQVIRKLVDLNFSTTVYPEFVFLPFTETNEQMLLAAFNQAIMSGAVRARAEDEVHIRQVLDFPKVSLEDIEAEQEAGGLLPPPPGKGGLGASAGLGLPGPGQQPAAGAVASAAGEDPLAAQVEQALGARGVRVFAASGAPVSRQSITDALGRLRVEHPDWEDGQLVAEAVGQLEEGRTETGQTTGGDEGDQGQELSDEEIDALIEQALGGQGEQRRPDEEDQLDKTLGVEAETAPTATGAPTTQELDRQVRAEHPDWNDDRVAQEVRRRLAGGQAASAPTGRGEGP